MTRKNFAGFVVVLALAAVASFYVVAPQDAAAQSGSASKADKNLVFTDAAGVAIKGYDPVAYFTAGAPTPGDERFTTEWRGATWRFASAENLAAFEQNPAEYAPAYGGYCAWGVGAQNELFPIDPIAWKIVDGTLYLNYDAEVQHKWLADIPGFIRTADANWPGLVQRKGE